MASVKKEIVDIIESIFFSMEYLPVGDGKQRNNDDSFGLSFLS
jgi:hypothetical protein